MKLLLLLSLLLPIFGAVLLLLFQGATRQRTARWIALGTAVATLLVSLALLNAYRPLVGVMMPDNSPVQTRRKPAV
jgi:NADH:ubiquinone oxidoreductase subunit 4 (subunit M)